MAISILSVVINPSSVYTNDNFLIQVQIEDTPVTFNEMDIKTWDSFSNVNTWNEIDQTQN